MKIVRRIIGWPAMVVLTFLLFIMLILVVYAGALGRVTDVSYINGELNEVGAYSLASQWLDENLDKVAPAVGDTETYTVFKDSLNEEWLEDQISGAMDSISDYMDRKTDTLQITLSTTGFKESMKTSLSDTMTTNPPQGLENVSATEMADYLSAANDAIDQLPGEIKVTVTNVSDLEPIRRIPELFHSAWAILFMLTCILAILLFISVAFLLDFSGTVCLRFFGVLLFVTGACCYAIKVVAVRISTDRIATADLPSLLTADTVTHMVKDTLTPAGIWGIVIGLIGIALFVASFFLFRNRGANA